MGVYVTRAELRAEPEVPDDLADAACDSLIARAERQVDGWLGPWPVQADGPSAGRKIVQADVDADQWTAITEAARRLAARLFVNPDVLSAPEWDSVSGPHFSTSGHRGTGRRIPDVVVPMRESGLMITGARART